MYRLRCKSPKAEATCRRASCVYPTICHHMDTDHAPTISLYRKARDLKGIKKILIASGVRYDLAVEDPRYIKELVKHHVGGYLKIAPEHTEEGPLAMMMKPGMDSYHRFKELFEQYSREAGKQQYLIPYFISAHPGTRDEDMVNLALWLKANDFKLDQVQNFYPSPLATATTMYYSEVDPLHKVTYKSEAVFVAKGERRRRLHKAILRYHDPAGWPMIRQALQEMGLSRLIGMGPQHLVPPAGRDERPAGAGNGRVALTRHTDIVRQRQPYSQSQPQGGKSQAGKSQVSKSQASGARQTGAPATGYAAKPAPAGSKPAAGAGKHQAAAGKQGKPASSVKGTSPERSGGKPARSEGRKTAPGGKAGR